MRKSKGGEGREECGGNVGEGRMEIHEKDRVLYLLKIRIWSLISILE